MVKKVIFLDRDGVINEERGDYTWRIEDFRFTDNLFEALSRIAEKGFEFVIVTNQGGIAKGLYGHEDVKRLNAIVSKEFKNHNLNRNFMICY